MCMNKNVRWSLIIILIATIFILSSCKNDKQSIIDIHVFDNMDPVGVFHKDLTVSDFVGGYESKQIYDLYFYQKSDNFTDNYPDAKFNRIEFEYKIEYDDFRFVKAYKNFLYFHIISKDMLSYIIRYDVENGSEELVFAYDGTNPIAIEALNDKYIIWQEDENANWLKVTLNCYDIKNEKNTQFFIYSRNEEGLMYSWNFDTIILDDSYVYFDNTESIVNDKANINLYKYDILKDKIELIAEKRAAQPILYNNNLSWIGYDDQIGEYILQRENSSKIFTLGPQYFNLFSSKNIIVGQSNINIDKDGIMYFDGKRSYPVLQSTYNIDRISCTDHYITWDGWSNDDPLFFDIDRNRIISVDCLEKGRRYAGIVNDDYLIFEAHEYVPDPESGDSAVKTKTMIYYFIKISDLRHAS